MFSEIIWPSLKKYIGIHISKQTLDSLYCIIQVHNRYPKLINGAFIPRVLETATELFCKESMNDIAKILIFVSDIHFLNNLLIDISLFIFIISYFSIFLPWKY